MKGEAEVKSKIRAREYCRSCIISCLQRWKQIFWYKGTSDITFWWKIYPLDLTAQKIHQRSYILK